MHAAIEGVAGVDCTGVLVVTADESVHAALRDVAGVSRTGVGIVTVNQRPRARPRRWVARAGHMTLVRGGTRYRVRADTSPALAGIGLRAGVAVVTGRPVRLVRPRGGAHRGLTGLARIGRVGCAARRERRPDATARLAAVPLAHQALAALRVLVALRLRERRGGFALFVLALVVPS
jgi:hypothetical protein